MSTITRGRGSNTLAYVIGGLVIALGLLAFLFYDGGSNEPSTTGSTGTQTESHGAAHGFRRHRRFLDRSGDPTDPGSGCSGRPCRSEAVIASRVTLRRMGLTSRSGPFLLAPSLVPCRGTKRKLERFRLRDFPARQQLRSPEMANKSSFTPEEWSRLVASPVVASMAITAADPGGLWSLLQESMSSGWALLEAKQNAQANAAREGRGRRHRQHRDAECRARVLPGPVQGQPVRRREAQGHRGASRRLGASSTPRRPTRPRPSSPGCGASPRNRPRPARRADSSALAAWP